LHLGTLLLTNAKVGRNGHRRYGVNYGLSQADD
jgi:hypothetical protein